MIKTIGIVAVDSNYGIGNQGKLLPFPKEDLNHFLDTVNGGIVVCTGNTYNAMSNKKNCKFFIYTRDGKQYMGREGVIDTCTSSIYLVRKAKGYAHQNGIEKIYVAGGTRLYNLLPLLIDEWVITKDSNSYESDNKLPFIHNVLNGEDFDVNTEKELTPDCIVYRAIKKCQAA